MSCPRIVRAFACAANGIVLMIVSERNARIHLFFSFAAVAAGMLFGIDRTEWIMIIVAIVLVWAAEAFNTAIERLTDIARPEYDAAAGTVKDIAAGGVLVSAIGAASIGIAVFGPRLLER